jgi:hypothetical protein
MPVNSQIRWAHSHSVGPHVHRARSPCFTAAAPGAVADARELGGRQRRRSGHRDLFGLRSWRGVIGHAGDGWENRCGSASFVLHDEGFVSPPVVRSSRIARRFRRSFSFARRIAAAISGAATFEKPLGSPRLRSVMRVSPSAAACQV